MGGFYIMPAAAEFGPPFAVEASAEAQPDGKPAVRTRETMAHIGETGQSTLRQSQEYEAAGLDRLRRIETGAVAVRIDAVRFEVAVGGLDRDGEMRPQPVTLPPFHEFSTEAVG